MHLKTAFTRAARAMREDAKLHLVAVSSLTVAFLCLATALLGMANLGEVAEAWGRTARMSIYLQDGASGDDSLWTAGVSGQGFEFRGAIDFSVLADDTASFDYCASPAAAGTTKTGPSMD